MFSTTFATDAEIQSTASHSHTMNQHCELFIFKLLILVNHPGKHIFKESLHAPISSVILSKWIVCSLLNQPLTVSVLLSPNMVTHLEAVVGSGCSAQTVSLHSICENKQMRFHFPFVVLRAVTADATKTGSCSACVLFSLV